MSKGDTFIELKDIVKLFPGVRALDGVSFEIREGEVHSLCGENGAGKSTLIKVMTGVHQRDGGDYLIDGKSVNFSSTTEGIAAACPACTRSCPSRRSWTWRRTCSSATCP